MKCTLHFVNKASLIQLALVLVMAAPTPLSADSNEASVAAPGLSNASRYLQAGEVYQAKRMTRQVLKNSPGNLEAQKLMARILDAEIAENKSVLENPVHEELSLEQKKKMAKTWLERSKSYLELSEYDEAVHAAESAITFDPDNREASRILDEIKGQAWRKGKQEVGAKNKGIEEEVSDRTVIYKKQARTYLEEGKPGAARLALEKLLMLSPEDKEALRMLEEVRRSRIKDAMMDQALISAEVSDEERKAL